MLFEQWYTTHCFDLESAPIGSRDCGLQRAAWNAAIESAALEAEGQDCDQTEYMCRTIGRASSAIRALSSNARHNRPSVAKVRVDGVVMQTSLTEAK